MCESGMPSLLIVRYIDSAFAICYRPISTPPNYQEHTTHPIIKPIPTRTHQHRPIVRMLRRRVCPSHIRRPNLTLLLLRPIPFTLIVPCPSSTLRHIHPTHRRAFLLIVPRTLKERLQRFLWSVVALERDEPSLYRSVLCPPSRLKRYLLPPSRCLCWSSRRARWRSLLSKAWRRCDTFV